MIESFTLSLAAVDVLSESLGLGQAPFPFEVPHNGQSAQQRAGILDAVLTDLTQRDLANRGRLDPEVAQALITLCSAEVAVTAIGLLDDGQQLLARAALANSQAVRAVLDGQRLLIDYIRPSALAQSMVELLPDMPPAIDQSITITQEAPASPKPEGTQFARMVRAPKTGRSAQLAAAKAILERPRIRVGQFDLILRGKRDRLPEIGWFDTDAGRYLMQANPGDDGRTWVTYAPTDKARLRHLIDEQLARA
jgi:hypothetical protein